MLTWAEFAAREPQLAASGRALLYQYGGVGLGFLGTVRPDGGPRVHPMCPILHRDGLYAFIIPGPKRGDLHRDPGYAMHCFPPEDNENAFYITGMAHPVADDGVRLRFHGRVRGLSSGSSEIKRSLMPTVLDWLRAQHGLSLLWGTTAYVVGLFITVLGWWRRPP